MKIAFYMEDGLEQIILTPETGFESDMLEKLHDIDWQLSVKKGAFYGCRGGWVRHLQSTGMSSPSAVKEDRSTILILTPTPPEDPSQ